VGSHLCQPLENATEKAKQNEVEKKMRKLEIQDKGNQKALPKKVKRGDT
jgi:hypothetical protein